MRIYINKIREASPKSDPNRKFSVAWVAVRPEGAQKETWGELVFDAPKEKLPIAEGMHLIATNCALDVFDRPWTDKDGIARTTSRFIMRPDEPSLKIGLRTDPTARRSSLSLNDLDVQITAAPKDTAALEVTTENAA